MATSQPRWMLIVSLGAAGLAVGPLFPLLVRLRQEGITFSYGGLAILFTPFTAGAGMAVGAGLAFARPLWLRLVIAACVSIGACTATLCVLFSGWSIHIREVVTFALLVVCPLVVTMTAAHHLLLARWDRARLRVLAPYAYVATGALVHVLASALGGISPSPADRATALAWGALVGLTQYYGLVAAVTFHRWRSARAVPTGTSPWGRSEGGSRLGTGD